MSHSRSSPCTYTTASGVIVICNNLDPLDEPLILKAIGGDTIIVIPEMDSAYIVDHGVILASPLSADGAVAGTWCELDWAAFNPEFPEDQKALARLAEYGIKPTEV